tara:strand:- start:1521 stop:1982 length:462 start_codon:yes stop_codon:yes gene_type:complete
MTEEKKQVTVATPRVLMLSGGQQVIAGIYVTEGSDFIRLNEPYKIQLHRSEVDSATYFVEEKMSLSPWMFQTVDKVYSIHKNHIMSIAMPNESLKEYYDNVRKGLFPTLKKEIQPLSVKPKETAKDFVEIMEEMSDEEYYETLQYLRGKIKPH